jgi:hypothetical protein
MTGTQGWCDCFGLPNQGRTRTKPDERGVEKGGTVTVLAVTMPWSIAALKDLMFRRRLLEIDVTGNAVPLPARSEASPVRADRS